ncbi:MAG: hypothetical protein RIC03_06930 [Cyclobacteriaceae bacterium]
MSERPFKEYDLLKLESPIKMTFMLERPFEEYDLALDRKLLKEKAQRKKHLATCANNRRKRKKAKG